MMQDNPFADLIPQTPQAPGVIYGRPKTPTPLELSRESRAADAADRAAAAADRAAIAQDRAAINQTRAIENDEQRLAREGISAQTTLRKEFDDRKDVQRFATVRTAREQIRSLVNNPNTTAQDDIALIFSFMRALDPNSVVREGEFATAQNAAGIPTQIVNYYNRALSGERLSGEQRKNFGKTVDTLYQGERDLYNQQALRYRDLAERQGIDPDLIARRYVPDEQPAQAQNAAAPNIRPQGDIAFGNTGGAPAGAEAYQAEVEAGIRNGTLRTADDVAAVAAKYRYAAPDRAETEKMFEALRNGARYGGAQAPQYASAVARRAEMGRERGDSVVDPFVRGAADTVSLGLADEISGIGNAIITGGNVDENIALQRATDQFDEQRNFAPRLSGQIAGGFALPVPAAANTPGRLAAVGAGYGAGYGFGSADGGLADRLAGAAVGGAIGGGVGYAGGSLAQRLANRPPPTTPRGVNQQTVDAAERQGVELVRPDVAPANRNAYGFLESLPFSGGRVRRDLQRGVGQIEQRVADVGQTTNAVPRQTAGENLQAAGERYVDRSRNVVSRLYDRAATLSGNSQVTPTQALSTIDSHIAQLSETPSANATKLGILNQLRADLVDQAGNVRPLSIQAIRDLRTAMRDELGTKGLRYTDTERRITDAIDSASTDIASQLSGPALRAFQRADRAYRERVDLVDNVVERFIGNSRTAPRSGEQVMSAVERAAKPGAGDAASLDRLMSRLQPAERQEVAATIASQLGRRADDAEFSPAVFFSQIKNYSPEARAAIFGRQGAADLADLQRIAEARGGTMARLNNSRSGQVGNWFNTIQSVLAGGGAGALVGGATGFGAAAGSGVGVVAAPLVAGGAYLTARSLGNRRVISALAQAARAQTPQARTQAISYLTTIANREPALTAEILPIRDALQAALSQAPGRAAANQEQQ